MINLKRLRKTLETHIGLAEWNKPFRGEMKDRITIKRKKKMVLEQTANGDMKLKRKSVIKIEIIE